MHDKTLKSGWGFSCLIEYSNKKILFDTGDDSKKLSYNLQHLKIKTEDLDAVILSHDHWDHTGGLKAIIEKDLRCPVYLEDGFSEDLKKMLNKKGIKYYEVDKMMNVSEGIFAGPRMASGGLREISATLKTEKGLVIITGCAHPGIINIIKEITKTLNEKPYLVLGGFHLEMSSEMNEIVDAFKKMEIKKTGPCHCTGERAISLFREEFKKDFLEIGSGLQIEI